ncbi:glycerol-3-phosphate dehydrogenase/oxidase [Epidermidibacterium keratini]|uniref:glycerol-3-phosphate dehydrogenase/oxidase n=1 Tax=Epidermidibacterium keratini TaxID=1891644 RepID=UPI001CEFA325|nr:glycerol-3-phosphate dehydrogenase/oxidase [Epidermidibacterium keratini]
MSVHWPSLSAERRIRDLDALASGERVDLLVVGGGITGAGIALDAASRGLSVALVERDDLASGTSAYSSRVVHGGTRYLATRGLGLAVESATERAHLMKRIAPHLVRTFPMLLPEYADTSRRTKALSRLGLFAGDLVRLGTGTGRQTLPGTRKVSNAEASALFPAIQRDGLGGGLLSFDAQLEDDARLVITVARTAAAYGAKILPRVRALRVDGDGADVVCELTGDRMRVTAGAVVNATGAWAGELEPSIRLGTRRGTHLLVRSDALGDPRCALAVSVDGDPSHVVFAIPQSDGLTLIGTTDVDAQSPNDGAPSLEEANFLLDALNPALGTAIGCDDIVGRFAGVRPVLPEDEDSDLSRREAMVVSESGVITIVGGKLTTYRKMAQDVVDKVVGSRMLWAGECLTATLPLVGAAAPERLAAMSEPVRLVRRYGAEAPRIADLITERPELGERVVPELPTIRAELAFAMQHELAITAGDLVDRRTRIGLTRYRDQALEVAARIVDMHHAR